MIKIVLPLLSCLMVPMAAMGDDLLDIYALAQLKDPTVRAALARRDSVREARPLALSGLLPRVSIGGNVSYRNQQFSDNQALDQNFGAGSLSIDLLQPVYRRDRALQVDQADWLLEQADADFLSAQQDLIFRTANAYFGVLAAQDDVAFSRSELKAIARQLDQAQQRFEVGLIAITDVHEAQARYDQARADEIRAVNNLGNAWEGLRTIIAIKPEMLAGLVEEIPLVPPEPAAIDAWSDLALRNSPIVQSSSHATQIAQKEIDVQYAGHFPTVDLFASYGIARTGRDFVSDSNDARIGLLLDVPLYTGGGVKAATRRARQDLMVSQENLDRTRRLVDKEVRDSYRGVQASISGVQALKAATLSAQSALEATEAGFEVGTRTQIDVLNSQRDLFRARRDYAQSRYNYILLYLRLYQAAGTLNSSKLNNINLLLN